ncbi:probable cellobiose dehydrogenase [Rhynchosporium secalis]|uniref:Probable cellobiose dehydrogenase n=1 Tax=Rhynchosporium secalis TaxID=38038 RepID=A0A1E1M9N3_RHYSE|nr:probable cellobiose dehydrogenase [Rhynchosporium secalis]
MKTTNLFSSILGAVLAGSKAVLAQDLVASHGVYTEPNTGITFYTSVQSNGTVTGGGWGSLVSAGGFTFGMALPPTALTVDATEYIGLIIGSTPKGPVSGWSSVLHGANGMGGASMPNHLMIVAWPTGDGDTIATSFRYSPSYQLPVMYKGTAKLTQIYSKVNATNWSLVYRCQNCFLYDDPTQTPSNTSTKNGLFSQGWAQALTPPTNPKDAASDFGQHDNGMGMYVIDVKLATQASYSKWATQTRTQTGTATGTATTTSSATSAPTTTISAIPVPPSATYDYVIVGGGAGGIPMADKLSAAGKSVLLIEKGVASSGRWGGTLRPEGVLGSKGGWLDGTNLTWFDVPGQCNRIWNGGSPGVACTDIDQMAGCILGGGTAVNAGLWWKPNPADWDVNFPAGWKSQDIAAATQRVFGRIPGSDRPSVDGKLYLQQGFDVITSGLKNSGWSSVVANNEPGNKNKTYAHPPYQIIRGERAGPMATYLVSAAARPNFKLWLNTSVERIVRDGGHATGLKVVAMNNGGYTGTVNLTPVTGRIIVSAGAFGTPKLLFRSGIGPLDQLKVVKDSTDGPTMINETSWINLPLGYNLDDHFNTDTVISHPNVTYYDWPASWNTPIEADKVAYLTQRSGPLAQSAPNLGPAMWEEIKGPDGINRHFQWTSRVEGSRGVPNGNAMTLSLYLGRGKVARGRTTIGKNLNMIVSEIPYQNDADIATVAIAIDHMVANLKGVKNLTWIYPPPGQTGTEYLKTVPLNLGSVGSRRANHWMGTAKLGTDSGLKGGTSVVDSNTKVYGTDNIFVVDASIFPGMVTTNPSALIVTASEHASDKILALPAPKVLSKYAQCGGQGWEGGQICPDGTKCTYTNLYYWQCL